MHLIEVSKNALVNPEMISAIEIRDLEQGRSLVVVVEGIRYISDRDPQLFLTELMRMGVDTKNEQFFSV